MIWVVTKLILSASVSFFGLIAFLVLTVLEYYPAAWWSFIAAVVSFVLSHVLLLELRKTLYQWYSDKQIQQLSKLALGFLFFGGGGLAYHSWRWFHYKIPITPLLKGEFLKVFWTVTIVVMSVLLLLQTYAYHNFAPDGVMPKIKTKYHIDTRSHRTAPRSHIPKKEPDQTSNHVSSDTQ